MSELQKKTSVFAIVQGGGGNIKQTPIKTKLRDLNESYAQVLNNIESWRVNKSQENITRYGQYWWWLTKNKTEWKYYGMYKNHPSNKHYEWDK